MDNADVIVVDLDTDPVLAPVPIKQYGLTEVTKLLFREFFNVTAELQDGSLSGKCLNCTKVYTVTEEHTSNLTRHLEKQSKLNFTVTSTSNNQQKNFDAAVVNYVVNSIRPFSTE